MRFMLFICAGVCCLCAISVLCFVFCVSYSSCSAFVLNTLGESHRQSPLVSDASPRCIAAAVRKKQKAKRSSKPKQQEHTPPAAAGPREMIHTAPAERHVAIHTAPAERHVASPGPGRAAYCF